MRRDLLPASIVVVRCAVRSGVWVGQCCIFGTCGWVAFRPQLFPALDALAGESLIGINTETVRACDKASAGKGTPAEALAERKRYDRAALIQMPSV